jgi:hypothetical protein
MSIAEGLLAGLQQPLSLEGAQLPADMSLYAGGGLDVLKAHEQKYRQQEYLDKQIKRNSKRLARELAKAYDISGYPEEQEKMSSVTSTPFIGSNVYSRRQYLLSKLAEPASPPEQPKQPTTEEPAPAEVDSPQYSVTGGVGPVNRLQMPPTPPTPPPTTDPYLSDDMIDFGQPNVYKPAPPPGIMSRIGGGLGRGMNYLEGLGTQAVRQGTYGAQQLANLALRNSDYLSGMVDDDQEARILGNLMQGSGTAGDEAFYGQQLQALRDRVNSPGRTQMQQGVLDTLAKDISLKGDHRPAQARALRNMHLEEQGRMMGIIPEGEAATPEQMAQLEKELGPTYDYFQGTSPEAQQAGVSAFGQPGGFTPISQYLGDGAEYLSTRKYPDAVKDAFGQARGAIGLPALNNAFRRARNALGFEDQMMVDPAKAQATLEPGYLQADIGDIQNVTDEDIDQQFMDAAKGGAAPLQIADSMLNRSMAPASRDTVLRAIQLYDSGSTEEAMLLLESLSTEDAARASRIMAAQMRASGEAPSRE